MTSTRPMPWDYIVIGAGSAGCAVAHELVKAGRTVLVLEAGGCDRSPFIKFPAGVLRAAVKHDWGYRSQPDPSRNGAREMWLRGKILGGSSSINGTMYVRGAAADFDRWSAQCGNVGGWSARDVLPIFRDMEASDQRGPLRGHCGPLYVRTVRRPHVTSELFVKSACAAGYPFNEDYNGSSQEGVSYAQLSQRRGFRCSAADAFLKPLLGRRNFKLLLHATVQKIEFSNGRARAVSFLRKGRACTETAREIILCAGAINSPQLLMLSGIGEPEELKRHAIDVELPLPGVGLNFQDHPLLRLTYRTNIATYNPTQGLLQKLGFAAQFLSSGEGPLSNIFEGTLFMRSSASQPTPDLKLQFLAVGYLRMPDGAMRLTPYPAVTVSVSESYPKSRGRIRLASPNPDDPPLIEYSMLGDQADVDTLVQGIHAIRRIMKTEPIAGVVEEEITPGEQVEGQSALQAFVRSHTGISFHSIGTCRMGIGADAVVGPDLRVRGTENLWIADASIMPDHISGNINAACMMIGAKLGKQLIARR